MTQILHLTDLHIAADVGYRAGGRDPRKTLRDLLRQLRGQRPDLWLMTGDLAHDGSPAAYRWLHRELSRLPGPILLLPGNHDHPERLRRELHRGPIRCMQPCEVGPITVIPVDTNRPRQTAGHVSTAMRQRLSDWLGERRHRPTLLALHHPLLPVGTPWMDQLGITNPQPLLGLLRMHPQVRWLLHGHTHQASQRRRDGLVHLGTPSSCIQFLPGARQFTLDIRPPGARRIVIGPDGRLRSEIIWLKGPESGTQPSADG